VHVLDSEKNDVASQEINSESESIPKETINVILNNPEHFKKMQEQINSAFSESERQNNDLISKANEGMMKQTMASILMAEEQNDNVIKELMRPVTNKSTRETVDLMCELDRLQSDVATQLK